MACQPGTKANDDKSMCVPCERGTYQAEPNQEECEICEDGKSTRDEGADQESLCEGIILVPIVLVCFNGYIIWP